MEAGKVLLSDEPISSSEQDLLGRKPFVDGLRQILISWNPSTSLVLGLSAAWGEGKTSTLNLLEPSLFSHGISVIRFNPWEWADKESLQDTFFDELSVELGRLSRHGTSEVAKKLRRYAARLGGTGTVATLSAMFLNWTFIAAAVVSVFGIVLPARVAFVILTSLLFVSALCLWSKTFIRAVADVLSPVGKELEPTLESLKKELATALKSWDRKILVILDDLDRLSPEATVDIIRLVKANGDLPRICYLLVGDRNVIEGHITAKLNVDGSAFIQKIIQFSFVLPALDKTILRGIFFDELNKVVATEAVNKAFDSNHWANIFWRIDPWLSNLRAVKRFTQTVRFHVEMLTGATVFEANIADLVGIEAIRVFEPKLYEKLKANRSSLASRSADRESHEKFAEILSGLQGDELRHCDLLLKALFPIMEATGEKVYGVETSQKWTAERRICSSDYFDRYFRFSVPSTELSDSELQFFFGDHLDQDYRSEIAEITKRGLLETLIDRLRAKARSIQKANVPGIITGLFDVGDHLSIRSVGMFGLPAISTAQFAVEEILRPLKDRQADALAESFTATSGLRLPIETLLRIGRLIRDSRLDFPIEESQLESWRGRFVEQIAQKARDESLFSSDSAQFFLQVWSMWGNQDILRKTISNLISDRAGALKFLRSLVGISRVSDGSGEYDRPYIRYSDIASYVDPEELYASLQIANELDREALSLSNSEFVLFQKARARAAKGIADDGFVSWDDEDE